MQLLFHDKNQDNRGQLYTSWDVRGSNIVFVQDRVSQSKHSVVRGFHSSNCWKLATVVFGRVRLVTYDPVNHVKYDEILCAEDKISTSVLIPPNILIAHQCLSLDCVLLYKWSDYYSGPETQKTVSIFDPTIDVKWEFEPILSERDKNAKCL